MRNTLIVVLSLWLPNAHARAAEPRLLSPADAVALAHADILTLAPNIRPLTRYLSLVHLPTQEERIDAWRVLSYHVNILSREPDFGRPALIGGIVLRLNTADYGWDVAKTWERLGDIDPFFHIRVQQEFGWYESDGVWTKTRVETKTALAPWLSTSKEAQNALAQLAILTKSGSPILHGSWFLAQTSQQADRLVGYYDWLSLGTDRKNFQELVGASPAQAKKRKEIAAVILNSTVALHNRQILRQEAFGGSYWMTFDVFKSVDKNNAGRLLNGDYFDNFDASEEIGYLPNGLLAYFLAAANGKRQDSAPDAIASDGKAPGTDRRVHPPISCIRCHEGLHAIDDWARKVYSPPLALQAVEYARLKRLRQLYLSNLQGALKNDKARYNEAVVDVTGGWTAEKLSREYAEFHRRYQEDEYNLDRLQWEVGIPAHRIKAALQAHLRAAGSLDPLLAGLIQEPELPLRAEHLEEIYSILQTILIGIKQ